MIAVSVRERFVRLDDLLDELVANDVALVEVNERDAIDRVDDLHRLEYIRSLLARHDEPVLQEMGARIDLVNPRMQAGEPVADLRVRTAPLRGVTIGPDRIPKTIDEFPILCVAAACAQGETIIAGASELRVKESDRIATMARELRRMGAEVEERPDGMRICGGRPLQGATCQSHGDHRVAMSMMIAGLVASGETRVDDTACVATSFPGFDKKLRGLLTPSGQG